MCRFPYRPSQVHLLFPNPAFEVVFLENQKLLLHLQLLTRIDRRHNFLDLQWKRLSVFLRMGRRVESTTGFLSFLYSITFEDLVGYFFTLLF